MAQTQNIIKEKRRETVEHYALRKLSTRGIEKLFERIAQEKPLEAEKAGMINPVTNEPWDHATIARDIIALEARWKEDSLKSITERKAEQLAELIELRKLAWQLKDLGEVRLALKLEIELMGTADELGSEGKPMNIKSIEIVKTYEDDD